MIHTLKELPAHVMLNLEIVIRAYHAIQFLSNTETVDLSNDLWKEFFSSIGYNS